MRVAGNKGQQAGLLPPTRENVPVRSVRGAPIRSTPSGVSKAVGETEHDGGSPWEAELLRRLAVSAPAGLVVVDTDGTVRLRNDEAARILGDVDRLPAALLAVFEQDANDAAAISEPVVVERGLRRLEVECRLVSAPSLEPLRAAWLTD